MFKDNNIEKEIIFLDILNKLYFIEYIYTL